MKHILATEQKKTDFRPEDENNVMIQYTTVRDTASTAELTCKTYKSADTTRKSLAWSLVYVCCFYASVQLTAMAVGIMFPGCLFVSFNTLSQEHLEGVSSDEAQTSYLT